MTEQKVAVQPSNSMKRTDRVAKSHWKHRMVIDLFLLIVIPTFIYDTIPFNQLTSFIPIVEDSQYATISLLLQQLESSLLALNNFRTNVAQPYFYSPFVRPIGLHQGVWDLFTGSQDHNYRIETIIHYRNDTLDSHMSPDWVNMSWYVKKRWQRIMTFYENFVYLACMDCYAQYYAERYGPKNEVRSVRLMLHSEQPPIEPPGNIFDSEFFFKLAKETLVSRPPKQIYYLNYCDDTEDECEEYMKMGYCTSRDDAVLLQMTKSCRRSCQLCNVDTDALDIGTRVSVYYKRDEQYFDGTVIETKILHTVRQYLIRLDGYEGKPEWTTSIALRQLGVRILTNENDKDRNMGSLLGHSNKRDAIITNNELSTDEL